MLLFKLVRSKLLIFTLLSFVFGITPAFAAISFSISNPQYNGDEIAVDVSLSGLTSSSCPNSYCFLQAALTSPNQIRYFGFTKNHNGQWYEYISSPNTSYIQSTFFAFLPSSGSWSGQITLKINPKDPDYNGPGSYNIKAWRYTGNSSNASGFSDTVLAVNIVGSTPSPIPTPSPTPTKTPSPTATPKKTTTPTSIPTSSPIPKTTPAPSSSKTESYSQPKGSNEISYRIASVAAVSAPSSPEAKVAVKDQKQTNPFLWMGIVFILIGAGSVGYIYLKKNGKLPI